MSGTDFVAACVNSIEFSTILILTALGLAITFGVMRVINMAHGDMLMLGAYTAYIITSEDYLGLSYFWAIPTAFLFVGLIGYLLEISLIRFLYGRPLDTLLATWGVSLIVQQTIFVILPPNMKSVAMPELLDGHWEISGVSIPYSRGFVVVITGLCLLAVYLLFYRTSFGLQMRAVTQNRPMASALGISTRRVDSFAFAFATGLTGVAGCMFSLLSNVQYDMGTSYVVEAFMVVILGGMGQLLGSIGAGALMGTTKGFVEKILVNAPMAKVIVLTGVILFLLIRPAGLFVAKERSYD